MTLAKRVTLVAAARPIITRVAARGYTILAMLTFPRYEKLYLHAKTGRYDCRVNLLLYEEE